MPASASAASAPDGKSSPRRAMIAALAPAVTTPVLITPQGVRIEGATVDALATLLRALR